MKQEIYNFINSLDTTLFLESDYEDENDLNYTTRENGDVGEEEYSEIDLDDALNVKRKLITKFGDKVSVSINTCDEWVNLTVSYSN